MQRIALSMAWIVVFSLVVFLTSTNYFVDASECLNKGFQSLYTTDLIQVENATLKFINPNIPKEINGIIIYNGLGAFEIGSRKLEHAFDGFSKLLSLQINSPNSSTFSYKFLQSNQWIKSQKMQDIAPYLMFESVQPPFNQEQKLLALLRGLDNLNVNIIRVNKQNYLVLNDYWRSYAIDPITLTTLYQVDPKVPGTSGLQILSQISTAHPLPDPLAAASDQDKEISLTFVSTIHVEFNQFHYKISAIRIKSPNERELLTEWNLTKLPYMHSFAMTKNHMLIFVSPLFVNPLHMIETAEPFKSLEWMPMEKTELLIYNLQNGTTSRLSFDDGVYLMHHINAYERADDGILIVDATAYEDTQFLKSLELNILLNASLVDSVPINSRLRRYQIDLTRGIVKAEYIQAQIGYEQLVHLEMPAINEYYSRYHDYCFIYGILMKNDSTHLSSMAIVKKNICFNNNYENEDEDGNGNGNGNGDGDGDGDALWSRPCHYPSEPIVIHKENGLNEDDAYVLSIVLDGVNMQSYLLVLDAKTMTEVNIAVLNGLVLPYRLHGKHFS